MKSVTGKEESYCNLDDPFPVGGVDGDCYKCKVVYPGGVGNPQCPESVYTYLDTEEGYVYTSCSPEEECIPFTDPFWEKWACEYNSAVIFDVCCNDINNECDVTTGCLGVKCRKCKDSGVARLDFYPKPAGVVTHYLCDDE
jgi:hypothetical protein